MAKHPLWNEEYWLLLLQLYQKKPMGVKPLYSKGMVDLSLELHIPPTYLHEQMFKLRMMTPRITRLWEKYANKPAKLAHDIKKLRQMQGYGNAESFYQGVEIQETFERDWEIVFRVRNFDKVRSCVFFLSFYFVLPTKSIIFAHNNKIKYVLWLNIPFGMKNIGSCCYSCIRRSLWV